MTQRDRDRLVVLRKAQKKLITQRTAAAELEMTERQLRRLVAVDTSSGAHTEVLRVIRLMQDSRMGFYIHRGRQRELP